LATDVDDQKRAEALLAGEKRVLEMAAGSHSMSEILEALCQLVENPTSGCYSASRWSMQAARVSRTEPHRAFRPALSPPLLAAP